MPSVIHTDLSLQRRKLRGVKILCIASGILLAINISFLWWFHKFPDKLSRCSPLLYERSFAVERNVKIDDQLHKGEQFHCPVCGKQTSGSFSENYRETGNCEYCGASNRFRQIALVVNGLLAVDSAQQVTCLNCTFQNSGPTSNLTIYNTQCSGTLHNILRKLPKYQCTEYYGPQSKYGDAINGIRNEDLQKLTFSANKFDLVISSEVFEHIPDPYKAHREVFRVLKPRGCHVFSVPFNPGNFEDKNIASLNHKGELIWKSEPMFHLDPIRKDGVPVFNIFGIEMLPKLCKLGFDASYFRFHSISSGILGPNAYIFLTCKR